MDRSNHYEAAFEAYLQWHRLCYVAVDETRRAQLGDMRVKNLDFIVYGDAGSRLLVDVKGRRFPTGSAGHERRVWECWSTQDDVDGLEKWTELFGPGYQALLVFAYQLMPEAPLPNDIDDEILRELTADDLIGLGVSSIGHRRKLLAAIAAVVAADRGAGEPAHPDGQGSPGARGVARGL